MMTTEKFLIEGEEDKKAVAILSVSWGLGVDIDTIGHLLHCFTMTATGPPRKVVKFVTSLKERKIIKDLPPEMAETPREYFLKHGTFPPDYFEKT